MTKTKKLQQDDIETTIDKAVDDAFERIDLDALIRDTISEMGLPCVIRRAVHEVLTETQAG